jgi:IclR family acetate operon transcriptional repressor
MPLTRYTDNAVSDKGRLERELERIRSDKSSTDNEEYVNGLVCASVTVLSQDGKPCASVAVHAPVARMSMDKALARATLRRAADALTQTYQEDDGAKPRAHKSAASKRRT